MRVLGWFVGVAILASLPLGAQSPGGLLVFERDRGGNMDIYSVTIDGGVEKRLTNHPAQDALPRFSPDGRSVIFSSQRTGEWQIFEMPATGGPAKPLRSNAHREWQADLSVKGALAFLSNLGGGDALYVQSPGGKVRELARHSGPRTVILGNPNWSPDGGRVVFSSNQGLAGHRAFVVDAGGGEAKRVTPLTSGACEPRFSRDGRRVVYVRRQHLSRERSQIVEQNLDDGGERVLVDWAALNYDPVFSHDGSELAFASTIAGEFAIYRLRLADGKSWRVSQGPGIARHPDYQRQ